MASECPSALVSAQLQCQLEHHHSAVLAAWLMLVMLVLQVVQQAPGVAAELAHEVAPGQLPELATYLAAYFPSQLLSLFPGDWLPPARTQLPVWYEMQLVQVVAEGLSQLLAVEEDAQCVMQQGPDLASAPLHQQQAQLAPPAVTAWKAQQEPSLRHGLQASWAALETQRLGL